MTVKATLRPSVSRTGLASWSSAGKSGPRRASRSVLARAVCSRSSPRRERAASGVGLPVLGEGSEQRAGLRPGLVESAGAGDHVVRAERRVGDRELGGNAEAGVGGSHPPGNLAGMTSPTKTQIKLEFLDINNAVISSSLIDVEAERVVKSPTHIANDNQWYQHTFDNVIAPANTRFARLVALMDDGVFNMDNGQSAFFDDFSLTGPLVPVSSVPEPSTLVGLALGVVLVGLRRTARRNG